MRVFIKALLFLQIACHVVCACDPNDCKSDLELERRSSHASLKTQPTTRGCFSRARQFVVNNLARLYYATSTVGYDTHQWGPFLKNYYSGKGWNQGSTQLDHALTPGDKAGDFLNDFYIAREQDPSLRIDHFQKSLRSLSFNYLYRDQEDCLNVLVFSTKGTFVGVKNGGNQPIALSSVPFYPRSLFYVTNEGYIAYAGHLMQYLIQQFPKKPIKIHSLQESSSSNRSGPAILILGFLESILDKIQEMFPGLEEMKEG